MLFTLCPGLPLWSVRYLDDGLLFGPLTTLDKVLDRLKHNLPELRLAVNLKKTVVVHSEEFSTLVHSTGHGS